MTEVLKIKLMGPDAIMPTIGRAGSAGLDIYAANDGHVGSQPVSFSTQLAVAIPEGHVGYIKPRSGLAFDDGIFTGAGVIDHGYTGEISVLLVRKKHGKYFVKKGDKIAQLVIQKFERFNLMAVDELDATERGADGYGSTGR